MWGNGELFVDEGCHDAFGQAKDSGVPRTKLCQVLHVTGQPLERISDGGAGAVDLECGVGS